MIHNLTLNQPVRLAYAPPSVHFLITELPRVYRVVNALGGESYPSSNYLRVVDTTTGRRHFVAVENVRPI